MVDVKQYIQAALDQCITETNLTWGKKARGKVRDTYDLGEQLLIITTDRQSAFDRVLASVPFKGQVLNLTSAWWFEKTRSIIPNHVIDVPDPNVTLAKKCKVFPVEFVVRGFITGTTNTSLWTHYQQGAREYCGNKLSEGLRKNQPLETPIITPTTKDTVHDRPISPTDIISEGLMTKAQWDEASSAALKLFDFGTAIALKQGLILVDTKYEMGIDDTGQLVLVDEIHTPDSSRYWIADTYEERMNQSAEPDNIDKEFLRLWFKDHCNPYSDETLPKAPDDLIITLSSRYIELYERIVGKSFSLPNNDLPVINRIEKNLIHYKQLINFREGMLVSAEL